LTAINPIVKKDTPAAGATTAQFILAAGLGFYWLTLWDALRIDWTTNTQYAFGWSVPFIAACFFVQRWSTRPGPARLPGTQITLLYALIAASALLQLPLRLLEEANAEWRILFWCREAQCVALTLGVIALAGGWRWARHFAFPVLFTATAVPWSKFIEDPFVREMMRMSARLTVEMLFWFDIPALQKGNMVELADGIVGVGEACSGMRSLQASLMLALVGGELWNLSRARRGLLVALGVVCAFALNIVRLFSLSVIAARRGFEVMKFWHDWFGAIEMGLCIAMVFGLTWLLSRIRSDRAVAPASPPRESKDAGLEYGAALAKGLAPFLIGVWISAALATRVWYGMHDVKIAPAWTVTAPATGTDGFAGLQPDDVTENERAQLRTNDCLGFKWQGENGQRWNLSFLRWPEGRSSEAAVTAHRPDLCLPGAGYMFIAENTPVEITINGVPMLFHDYLFQLYNEPVRVFYLLSDLKTAGFETLESDLSLGGRFRAALAGRRNNRRAILEVIATGPGTDAGELHSLQETLEKIVSRIPVAQTRP
jgi:exosortase